MATKKFIMIQSREEKESIFKQLESENLLNAFMYSCEDKSFDIFDKFISAGKMLACYEGKKLVSVFIVSPEINNSGMFHVCFTREYFSEHVEVTKKALHILFTEHGFDSFFGITPKNFMHMFEPAKNVGFELIAELHGFCKLASNNSIETGILSVINKNTFLESYTEA